ncbi:hypothetical protein ABT150_23690 [Streptomyces mirabilis]|uniref:hypothetical protein n=1 Tax=Streptomyces mirabilis TaxID=68239 RepID=UPI00332486DB
MKPSTAVRFTGDLLVAATNLRDLGDAEISASDDPVTMLRDLHAALDALRAAWPSVSKAAHFDGPIDGEDSRSFDAVADFTDRIRRGLDLATAGLWDATSSI